jgi:hypothetical protein
MECTAGAASSLAVNRSALPCKTPSDMLTMLEPEYHTRNDEDNTLSPYLNGVHA